MIEVTEQGGRALAKTVTEGEKYCLKVLVSILKPKPRKRAIMPITHGRKIGSRPYRNYTDSTLIEALDEIKSNKISLRIHKHTLWLKLKGRREGTPGHPTLFTETEEKSFMSHCLAMSNYGFPFTGFDLRCIMKSYLDRVGRTATFLRTTFPAFAQSISTARAAVDEKSVRRKGFQVPISGTTMKLILEDIESSKIITKRGTNYPERIQNSTKACTSVMFCGNAEGKLAPIYFKYKSRNYGAAGQKEVQLMQGTTALPLVGLIIKLSRTFL
ncbi:hypothetical protein J437_LFUL008240 [Ladona fulva]|uniref:Uncharacterized protein n=1 Tax=Ladona fulva TaxID=123851 RepID=A0A8K0K833_LADFU|nr:hypothetical protein J437_LFUL008240 [Ladona fulva]